MDILFVDTRQFRRDLVVISRFLDIDPGREERTRLGLYQLWPGIIKKPVDIKYIVS